MLKAGDVLFFNRGNPNNKWYHKIFTSLQRKLDNGVIHVEIVVEELPDGKVLTLGSNADGTKYRKQIWNHSNIEIHRHKYIRNFEKFKQNTIEVYKEMELNKNTKYDYSGLANSTINQVFEVFTLGYWKKKNIFRNQINTFCSKFAIRTYNKNGFILNRKGEDTLSESCTPGDLYAAYDFEVIKPFGVRM